ncbi:CMP-N-acetylneuraminate-beta-galactosamide-alpha-2,3-sialyltransferase 4-like isoform X1 [Brienomyrus brachyistius]|uniref:CMP-N-acetylneuraminate-beta-galactosamide- alpha-2,3-sialyltransferase 4-like isoform X1 n=1 Tax=Brienomyrus brachyistius TaxID=42636 RepID=UPI0020B3423B|nr:CMP-N-acetylneuraminate-beta-galactosamide-alpha-2,3-sialyltransferase 4-like isoform X1 [Brienomyrus brachyistius]XP_048837170.1 CMP-N-acetylneuraminate-beta-galactosamide-alpha-2,3-sialyltransferase 4-like isoform X1 [Brienomyrus brachyistius]XP_048837171.1 CMP-N-acetylneuraminate-beta-galactosamide-alpha-2,3-sialyltransferase 4-like isoform X1 [Brienomyrus brachyistius]XP_048837172.1 CMP-N-acetylneuraminate-beta-galactosamide-alpha-2,3-sialyltransferase 4-like isoform X1 [Brienomyrus brach
MSMTLAKTWAFRLLPVVLFVISYYYYSYFVLQGAGVTAKSTALAVSPCGSSHSSKKWAGLDFNVTRNSTLFLKLEDYFWHERSSPLSLPYGMKGSEFLLLKVLAVTASYEMPESISKLDCRTCIVVGNGYTIKNSSLGSIINTYDVVIRLNDAPVRGYEADVGSKTTLRLFYPESASHQPALHNNPDTLMVLVPFKQNDLRWLKEILYDEKRVRKGFWKPPPQIWQGKSSHIRILDPYFLRQTASKLLKIPLLPKWSQRSIHPTTGILAIYMALSYCDVVHITGFGYPLSKNQKDPIHYYGSDTMTAMKNSYHDLSHEAQALKRLEKSGAIQYLLPQS